GDKIGSGGVIAAASGGNFAVLSPNFAGGKGAITVANATAGTLSASNSLIGAASGDALGSGGGAALANGDFVVASPGFGGGLGAASFLGGNGGTVGAVSIANSLIGTATTDHVGSGGVLALATGNYLVMSPNWNGGSGAVTFGNGTTGTLGAVSAGNGLVGVGASARIGTPDDATPLVEDNIDVAIGASPIPATPRFGVLALATGNYLVTQNGAVTFGNGKTGVTATVSAQNSLLGVGVGGGGIVLLPNGNYLVSSPFATINGLVDAGAVTFGNGMTGVTGTITAQNSLVGANSGDLIGFGFQSLPFPESVKGSELWQLGVAEGKVPFGRLSAADFAAVGINVNTPGVFGTIAVLSNGDYVVSSPFALSAQGGQGAATFGSGTTGVTGVISAQNSVFGNSSGGTFANIVQDDPANGTFVVSSVANFGQVTIVGGSLKGIETILGAGSPSGSVTITPTALQNALAGGNSVTLVATNDITVASPLNLGNGALTLDAGNDIFINAVVDARNGSLALNAGNAVIFNADVLNSGNLLATAAGLGAGGSVSEITATFNGISLPDQPINQMLAIAGKATQPGTTLAAMPYAANLAPRCVTVRPDGSCETEPAVTLGDALAARGNAYLDDLLYRKR
ncbi:MAG: hypothetical protein JO010_06090, partial [Alphaproteobacteria bacterium]|nr:hypothetical protein [Alphaproteobacteria bacterium]